MTTAHGSSVYSCLDHFIWACDDLERGSRRFEALTGVRPRYGGTHAGGLTHNALVAIGQRCYLEILAPTGPPTEHDDAWCRLARAAIEPRVLTYCLRSSLPLSELASIAANEGDDRAVVARNGRTTPEGMRLNWEWLGPIIEPFGLAFPFFIDWLGSLHPADACAPSAANGEIRLLSFAVGHPQAASLRQTLKRFGASIETYPADGVQFRVRLRTPLGDVSL